MNFNKKTKIKDGIRTTTSTDGIYTTTSVDNDIKREELYQNHLSKINLMFKELNNDIKYKRSELSVSQLFKQFKKLEKYAIDNSIPLYNNRNLEANLSNFYKQLLGTNRSLKLDQSPVRIGFILKHILKNLIELDFNSSQYSIDLTSKSNINITDSIDLFKTYIDYETKIRGSNLDVINLFKLASKPYQYIDTVDYVVSRRGTWSSDKQYSSDLNRLILDKIFVSNELSVNMSQLYSHFKYYRKIGSVNIEVFKEYEEMREYHISNIKTVKDILYYQKGDLLDLGCLNREIDSLLAKDKSLGAYNNLFFKNLISIGHIFDSGDLNTILDKVIPHLNYNENLIRYLAKDIVKNKDAMGKVLQVIKQDNVLKYKFLVAYKNSKVDLKLNSEMNLSL